MWDQCGVFYEHASTWKIQPPLLNQVHQGCTQREAEVDHEAVHAKADLCPPTTTTEVMNEKQHKIVNSSQSITAWSHHVEGQAEEGVARKCELACKSAFA